MVDAWPDTLPRNFIAGYSDGTPDNLVESSPEIGPPMSRPRSTTAVRPLSGQMRMTRAQIAALDYFFRVTLAMGALPFTFPDPTFGGNVLVKFGKSKQPTWVELNAATFRVNIQLLVLP